MTQRQWDVMADVVAELCRHYQLRVTSTTVLAHGEVQAALNIKQDGKWDPLVLPWAPTLPRTEIMEGFRTLVRQRMAA